MIEKFIAEVMENHRGKALGMLLGLLVGIFLINFGILKTILLAILVIAGYVIGKRFDNNDDLRDILNKFIYNDKKPR